MKLALPLLAALLLAGCAGEPAPETAAAAAPPRAPDVCEAGSVVVGLDGDGRVLCRALPHMGFVCEDMGYVGAFQEDGTPVCATAVLVERWPEKEATQEVPSTLKVLGIYGLRASTQADLHAFKVNVELAAGSLPLDLRTLVLRFADGVEVANYVWGPRHENGTTPRAFEASCIRGDCSGEQTLMEAGDLVELHFTVPPGSALAERTLVDLALIPESGTPVDASFRTPATYGTDLVITLR